MLGFLICLLWGLIYAAVFLAVVEIVAWGAKAVFQQSLPERAIQLLRVVALLLFLVYVVMCIGGHVSGPGWPQHG